MKVYKTPDIRSVALVGHGDSGKTSLASALLFSAGAIDRQGSVDDGSSTTDFDEEEIERKISLQTSIAHLEWKNKKINLIDTPGYAAFVADAKVALRGADAAVLLVEAVSGVQVITERIFEYAKEAGLPLLFAISKLDRENASFQRTLDDIQERFGRTAIPIQIPIGEEQKAGGVVDLISMRASITQEGKTSSGEIPGDLADADAEARSALVEMVAETDDDLMSTFFDAGDLNGEQLATGLRNAVVQRKIFPVVCTAANVAIGAQLLLDTIVDVVPAPDARGDAKGTNPKDGGEVSRAVGADQPLSLFVFKTVADPFAGKLSIFRVISGTLAGDSAVHNATRDAAERLSGVSVMQGKQVTAVPELHAGDIGVISKLKETQTSDTLADPAHPITYPAVSFRDPAISFAVEPKSKGDEEKITAALNRLMEEDPVLRVKRDPKTAELPKLVFDYLRRTPALFIA